jgi:hypothetical protein
MNIFIQLDNIKTPKKYGEILPGGIYPVRITSAREERSYRGTLKIRIRMEIIEGPYKGHYIYDNLYLTEKSLTRLKAFLEVIGLDTSIKFMLTEDLLINRTCNVELIIENYDNGVTVEQRNKVSFLGYLPYRKQEKEECFDVDFEDVPF